MKYIFPTKINVLKIGKYYKNNKKKVGNMFLTFF